MGKTTYKKVKTVNEKGEITIHIEGIGTVTETGKLDVERFVRNLLKNPYITGEKDYK